jgi:hypothetical protein
MTYKELWLDDLGHQRSEESLQGFNPLDAIRNQSPMTKLWFGIMAINLLLVFWLI